MLADAAQAAALGVAVEAATVVDHAQHNAVSVVFQLEPDLIGTAVPRRVREALLRDAVDDELDCRIERRQLALEAPPHGDAGPLREAARETRERAREAEVVERLRPELLRNPADLLEARSYRLLRVRERLLLLGRRES